MKATRALSFLLSLLMVISAFGGMTFTAAAEESAPAVEALPTSYVKAGLVALYSGTQNTREGHDTASAVWQDLIGGNDVTVSLENGNAFTDEGYFHKAAQNFFPQAIVDVINGESFTVELLIRDLKPQAPAYCTMLNSSNDNFALFRRNSSDVLEFKFAANAAASRNTIADCQNLLQDALITVTYEVGGKSSIYINGELMSEMDAPSAMGANDFFFGHNEGNRFFDALYRSMRFYDRALTKEEIVHNAAVDGQVEIKDLYVTDGLVSLYSGINTGADEAVWEDLIGDNDLPINVNDANYFTDAGLRASGKQHNFPQAIVELVNGNEFTVEIQFDDFVSIGESFNTFMNSKNDNFALFRRCSNDQLEFKFAGNPGDQRTKVDDGLELIDNGLVTITYKVGGNCTMYVDGEMLSERAAPSSMGADNLFIGHSDPAKSYDTIYRNIRFYNRALTADEVMQNARYDGATYKANVSGPVVETPGYVTVAQPKTNIVGDISLVRRVNDKSELDQLTAATQKPAIAMYAVNDKLQVLDDKGAAFATVGDVLAATEYKVLSAFIVSNTSAVDALVDYLKAIKFYDCLVVSQKPELVNQFRTALPTVTGVIDFTETYKDATELTKEQCLDIRRTLKNNFGTIAILPTAACESDGIQFLYERQVNVWAKASDAPTEAEQYRALLSGAIGVISDATASLLDIATNKLPANTMSRVTLNVGHRGIPSKAPENTLEGAKLAYEEGANVIEIDVYLTTDGQVVIMHDGTTGRTCNRDISVEGSTLAQLRELYVNKGYENNAQFKECRIPTFEEYLEFFKDKDCNIFIEIKSNQTQIVKKVKELVEKHDMYDHCSVITFNEGIMAAMRRDWPEMSVGALCGGFMGGSNPESELRQAMTFIGKYNATLNPSSGGFEANDIRAALQRGISIYPWTFRGDINTYKSHLLWGYSGLTGDNANVLQRLAKDIAYTGDRTATVDIGATLTPKVNVTTYQRKTAEENPEITVISGADIVTVNDGTLTFTGAGEVSFILSYKQARNMNYHLFVQPITITVKGEEETTVGDNTDVTEPETNEDGTNDADETTGSADGDSTGAVTNENGTNAGTDKTDNGKGCASAIGGLSALLLLAGAALAIKRKRD